MTPKEYTKLAMRTESKRAPLSAMDELCTAFSYSRLLHSALGCTDEAGEIVKGLKDCLFYGKELDTTNLKEEYGDQLWYIALGLDALGSSFEEVMEMNIQKLRTRYPDKFSDEAATQRDVEAERETLNSPTPLDIVTAIDLPKGVEILSSPEIHYTIMTGHAKGEIVQIDGKYVLRIRE